MTQHNPRTDPQPAREIEAMDTAFGKFPDYMVLVPDIFRFSYDGIMPVMARFRRNSDLLTAIDHTIATIRASEMSEDEKAETLELLEQEKDVISYSIVSRSSVITI